MKNHDITQISKQVFEGSQVVTRQIVDIGIQYSNQIIECLKNSIETSVKIRENFAKNGIDLESIRKDGGRLRNNIMSTVPFSILMSILSEDDIKVIMVKLKNMVDYIAPSIVSKKNAFVYGGNYNLRYISAKFINHDSSRLNNGFCLIPTMEVKPIPMFDVTDQNVSRFGYNEDRMSISSMNMNHLSVSPLNNMRIYIDMSIDIDTTIMSYYSNLQNTDNVVKHSYYERVGVSSVLTTMALLNRSQDMFNNPFDAIKRDLMGSLDGVYHTAYNKHIAAPTIVDFNSELSQKWIRVNMTRVSSLFDAIVGTKSREEKSYNSARYGIHSGLMDLLTVYLSSKFSIRNDVAIPTKIKTIKYLIDVAEPYIRQIEDPLLLDTIKGCMQDSVCLRMDIEKTDENKKKWEVVERYMDNIKHTLMYIIISYAATNVDAKYKQFNPVMGDYKDAIKSIREELNDIVKYADNYSLGWVNFFKYNGEDWSFTRNIINEFTTHKYIELFQKMSKLYNIYEPNEELFYNIMHNISNNFNEIDADNKFLLSTPNIVAKYEIRSLEAFIEDVEKLENSEISPIDGIEEGVPLDQSNISMSTEDEFGYGNYSVLNALTHESEQIEDTLVEIQNRVSDDSSDEGDEDYGYVQIANESLKRFDATLIKHLNLKSIGVGYDWRSIEASVSRSAVEIDKDPLSEAQFKSLRPKIISYVKSFVSDFEKYIKEKGISQYYKTLSDREIYDEFHGVKSYDLGKIIDNTIEVAKDKGKKKVFVQFKLALSEKKALGENAKKIWNQALGYAIGKFRKSDLNYIQIVYYYSPSKAPTEQSILIHVTRPIELD